MLNSKSFPILAGAAALGLSVAVADPASATITTSLTPTLQQQLNNPCVIGNSSCNQGGFNDIEFNGTPGGGQNSTYVVQSPDYVAANIFPSGGTAPNTINTQFSIGIDENISAGQGNEVLQFFQTFVCTLGAGCGTSAGGLVPPTVLPTGFAPDLANTFSTVTTIPNQNNGNGRSDLNLDGFSLVAGNHYLFRASVSNDTDGMEQFFVSAVPAPIIGHGLLALLAIGGVLSGSRLLERSKKNRTLAAAA